MIISIHPTILILKSPFTYIVYRQFTALFKSFGEISPNSLQVIKFIDVIGTICFSGVTFIEILIKDNKTTVVSIYTHNLQVISRCLGYKNHKIKAFPANANIYSFCKLNLNTNLKRPVKFKFNKGTIDTHSTIANGQHRVFSHFSYLLF